MDLGLTDKVVFVAGSSRGIGRAIARAFHAEGARVVVTGRDVNSLARTAAEFGRERVLSHAGDLSREPGISAALNFARQQWGTIDVLVANIGSGSPKLGLDESLEVNFWCSVRLVEAVLPAMVEARHGAIIFIGSIAALETGSAPLPYSAAKAALLNYSKNLACKVGPHGVRVNYVAPGNVFFPGGSWEAKLREEPGRFEKFIETEVPLQRFGTPEEIANVVVFLASERAAFVTGACVVADGGQAR